MYKIECLFFILQQTIVSSQDSSFIQNNFSVIIFSLGLFLALIYIILQIKVTIAKNISIMQEFEEKRFNNYIQTHNFSNDAHYLRFKKIDEMIDVLSERCYRLEVFMDDSSRKANKIEEIIYSEDKHAIQISSLRESLSRLKTDVEELKVMKDEIRKKIEEFQNILNFQRKVRKSRRTEDSE